MKCPECNAFVKTGAEECPKFGHKLPKADKAQGKPSAKKAPENKAAGPKKGGSKIVDMRKGEQRFPSAPKSQAQGEEAGPKRTIKPVLAAVFLFIVAVQCLVQTVYYIVLIDRDYYRTVLEQAGYTENLESMLDLAMNITVACEILFVIVAIFAVIAGILAIKRIKWGICLTGAIIAIFSGGLLFSGTILAIVALILIIVSRKEFVGMVAEDKLPEPEINR